MSDEQALIRLQNSHVRLCDSVEELEQKFKGHEENDKKRNKERGEAAQGEREARIRGEERRRVQWILILFMLGYEVLTTFLEWQGIVQ